MILEGEEILNDYKVFLDTLFEKIEGIGLSVKGFDLDHICYRVASEERYRYLKMKLSEEHQLIIESQVNGRPISNFLLKAPIHYNGRQIKVLELPAPKSSSSYTEGYEHIEFVVDDKLEEFLERNPEIEFNEKGLKKSLNREVRYNFGSLSVKFHEMSLINVIQKEQANQSNES